ncbi:MAG: ribbon-helix-helix protein, CopG family [Ignisphaera sp.]|uniref:Ribbon-helix-helix protein, CopG family n=1 Tax=Ignisphaera aggregans TaxID=334771 RepID=A0A7J3N029_9CREN
MKTIAVDEETWRKLRELKDKMGCQSFNELINELIKRWHMNVARENIERISIDIDPEEATAFFRQIKRKQGSNR